MRLYSLFVFAATIGLTGCYDPNAQQSAIVRQVEAAGAGNISTFTLSGLVQFFSFNPGLAAQIAKECRTIEPTRPANWITSAEGTACHAAILQEPPPPILADQRKW